MKSRKKVICGIAAMIMTLLCAILPAFSEGAEEIMTVEAETGELKALREFRKQLDAWRMAAAAGLTDASDLSFASSMLETCVDRVRVLTGNALGFTLHFGLTLTEFLE